MAISTAFTELLGISHPIVQAPMGLSAGGALAAAVSNGGGLGCSAAAPAIASGWTASSRSWPAPPVGPGASDSSAGQLTPRSSSTHSP
jgi:hypothetical protein